MSLDALPSRLNRLCHRFFLSALALLAVVALPGCQRAEPVGQVIADVDGVELTLSELNAEAQARAVPIASDRARRSALIAELVDRKLLVRAARDSGIERTPQFVLTERRNHEILLAQQLIATRIGQRGEPSDKEVEALIARSQGELGQVGRSASEQIALARAWLRQRRAEEAMQQIVNEQRKRATVRFQRGFEPDRSPRQPPARPEPEKK